MELIQNFINKLKTVDFYNSELVFNSWKDGNVDSVNKKCNNLKMYLETHLNSKYILLGESPSYGAKYTGIAMTSEQVLNNNPQIFGNGFQTTSETGNTRELTASTVWQTIAQKHEKFVLWNVFAFNSHQKNSEGPRTPSNDEIEANFEILKSFFDIFEDRSMIIVPVGRTAEKHLQKLNLNKNFAIEPAVRHPSCGGSKKFKENMQKYLFD